MVRVLGGLFLAGLNKTLRETHGEFITSLVRHLVLCWIANYMDGMDQTLEAKPPVIVSSSVDMLDPITRMGDGPTLTPLTVGFHCYSSILYQKLFVFKTCES